MQTPLPYTYPVIQKNGSSALPDVFWDILRLKVGSLQWFGPMLPRPKISIFLFQTSLVDWESWKINVKIGLEPITSQLFSRMHCISSKRDEAFFGTF
jgi:hypothetical protein